MTEFNKVTLPPKDKRELFYPCNRFLILSIGICQSISHKDLLFIDTPKYVRGKVFI